MSTPQTTISICMGIGFDQSYTHALWFPNVTARSDFFESKVIKRFTDYTYCRHKWSIKVNATFGEARKWEYLFFRNPSDNQTYYYFITSVEYKSDTLVELHLEMDVIQTYLFMWSLKPCFIERMTPKTDAIGENTIDEGLELGEICYNNGVDAMDLTNYYLMVMSTVDLNYSTNSTTNKPEFSDVAGEIYDGVFSGCRVFCVEANEDNMSKIQTVFNAINTAGKTDGIISMWLYPKSMVKALSNSGNLESINHTFLQVSETIDLEFHVNKPTTYFKGYTPKNNKLWCYPYFYLHVHNNLGNYADFKYEYFNGNEYIFDLVGSVFPDGGVKCVPRNYKGFSNNYEEGLTLTGFPTCAWISDAYKIWLAQNQAQHTTQIAQAGLGTIAGVGMIVAGAMTANPMLIAGGAGSLGSSVMSVSQQLAQRQDMKSIPDQARGNQSASINASQSKLTFSFINKCITPERARIIDDYFTMYGYKQNIVDKPSIHNRELFTYVKTVGCTVGGAFNNEDKVKIASIFDKGVTFWTDPEKIGKYDETNGFLS